MQRKLKLCLAFTLTIFVLIDLQDKEVYAQPAPNNEAVLPIISPPIIIGIPIKPPPTQPPLPSDCTCESIQIFTSYVANAIVQAWCSLNQFLFNCIINAVNDFLPPYLVYCIQRFLDELSSRICKTHF